MSGTNFAKILIEAIREIRNSIRSKYDEEYKKLKRSLLNTKRQLEITNTISDLEKQIKDLNEEYKSLDPRASDKDKEIFEEKYGITPGYSDTNTDLKTRLEICKTPVYTNIEEFDNIAQRFSNMMNLAVGGKEQRSVLLQFYSLDWRSLGIDIPCSMDISNIKIQDGQIISDTSRLLN